MTIHTLEPHLLDGLRLSAREILETMVFMTPKSIEAEAEDQSTFEAQVIGLLGFTGSRTGTFVVRTDEELAKAIAAKMLMMEPGDLGSFQEAADGFGELVNMLAGNFKNAWVAAGNRMDLSVPNVIHNGSVSLKSSNDGALRSRLRIELEQGHLDIGVHFEPKE